MTRIPSKLDGCLTICSRNASQLKFHIVDEHHRINVSDINSLLLLTTWFHPLTLQCIHRRYETERRSRGRAQGETIPKANREENNGTIAALNQLNIDSEIFIAFYVAESFVCANKLNFVVIKKVS